MLTKITLPKKLNVPKIDIEFSTQETADLGMAVYFERMSIPSYLKNMDKVEKDRRERADESKAKKKEA